MENIPEETKKEIKNSKHLIDSKTLDIIDSAMSACFIEPKGDPNRSNLYPAACMAKILIDSGYTIDEDFLNSLHGDNMCNHDFLKEVEEDFKL